MPVHVRFGEGTALVAAISQRKFSKTSSLFPSDENLLVQKSSIPEVTLAPPFDSFTLSGVSMKIV